jgi:DNA polymerase-4
MSFFTCISVLGLKRLGEERLRSLLGKQGSQLYRFACGENNRPVESARERKSIGKETTFEHDLVDRVRMVGTLEQLAVQVEHRLVELGLRGRTLTLKVRWSNFQLVTRSTSRRNGFQTAQEMLPVLSTLLAGLCNKQQAVRLLGVTLSHLQPNDMVDRGMHVAMPSLWDAV